MIQWLATFVFAQAAGWLGFRCLPPAWHTRLGSYAYFLWIISPSSVVALLLLALHRLFYPIWVSPAGAVASLLFDMLWLSAASVVLWIWSHRVRAHPGNVRKFLVLAWSSDGYWRSRLSVLFLLFPLGPATLRPADLRQLFDGDVRYVDSVSLDSDDVEQGVLSDAALLAEAGLGGMAPEAVLGDQPHFPVFDLDETPLSGTQSFTFGPKKYSELITDASVFALNRGLNTRLPAPLWEASRHLCVNTPSFVAASWKAFHFQTTARLRLVCLFNSADYLQRLVASAVFASLRDRGALRAALEPDSLARGSLGDWNRLLERSLRTAVAPELASLRDLLVSPRRDALELIETLEPWCGILNLQAAQLSVADTLGAFRMLGDLRNATLGHGAVGSRVGLRPEPYVAALHRFFLMTVRDVVNLNLAVSAFHDEVVDGRGHPRLVGVDRGVAGLSQAHDRCRPKLRLSEHRLVNLYPYLRFRDGRLLVLNRLRPLQAEYVDCAAKNYVEPSFVTVPEAPSRFFGPNASGDYAPEERLMRQIGDQEGLREILDFKATWLERLGDLNASASVVGELEDLWRDTGDCWKTALAIGRRARLVLGVGDSSGALELFEQQERAWRSAGLKAFAADAMCNQAEVIAKSGDRNEAARRLRQATADIRAEQEIGWRALALLSQGSGFLNLDLTEESLHAASEAESISRDSKRRDRLADALWLQARALDRRDDLSAALAKAEQASSVLRSSGDRDSEKTQSLADYLRDLQGRLSAGPST